MNKQVLRILEKPSVDGKANRQLRDGENPQGKSAEAEGNLNN